MSLVPPPLLPRSVPELCSAPVAMEFEKEDEAGTELRRGKAKGEFELQEDEATT